MSVSKFTGAFVLEDDFWNREVMFEVKKYIHDFGFNPLDGTSYLVFTKPTVYGWNSWQKWAQKLISKVKENILIRQKSCLSDEDKQFIGLVILSIA